MLPNKLLKEKNGLLRRFIIVLLTFHGTQLHRKAKFLRIPAHA